MENNLFTAVLDRLETLENRVQTLEQAQQYTDTTGEAVNGLTVWTPNDIATFLQCTREHVYRKVMLDPNFPQPITQNERRRKYLAADVMAYVKRNREQNEQSKTTARNRFLSKALRG